MRITWMLACEQIVLMSDGRPYAMGVFTGDVPWIGPGMTLPISVLFTTAIEPDDTNPKKLTMRLNNPDGKMLATHDSMLPGNATPGYAAIGQGMGGGMITFPAPGDYEIQLCLDGIRMDDWPTWSLRLRDVREAAKAFLEGGGPSLPPPPAPGTP